MQISHDIDIIRHFSKYIVFFEFEFHIKKWPPTSSENITHRISFPQISRYPSWSWCHSIRFLIFSFIVSNGSSFLNCPSNYSCIDILTRSNIYSVVIFTTIVVTISIIILSLLLPLVILPDHDDFAMTSLRHYDATFTPWRSLQLNNRNPLCRNQHIIWESLLVPTFLGLARRLRIWRRRHHSISWSCGQIRFCQQCNSDRWARVMSNSSSIKLSWKWEIVIFIFYVSNRIYIHMYFADDSMFNLLSLTWKLWFRKVCVQFHFRWM